MLEENVGIIDKMIQTIKKHGVFRVCEAIFFVVAFLYLMHNSSNLPTIMSEVLHRNNHSEMVEHDAAVDVRRRVKPKIDALLNETLYGLNADRCFVIEMHNGTNNTAGLPFIYGEMTYECANGVADIDEDYISINLSRFDLPYYLEQRYVFCGNIKQLEQIDKKLAKRINANDVSYLAIITIHGSNNELGYFGVTYCNNKEVPDTTKITNMLSINSQKLSILIDSQNVDNNNH